MKYRLNRKYKENYKKRRVYDICDSRYGNNYLKHATEKSERGTQND